MPISESNRKNLCNKLFAAPTLSPFSNKPVTLKTQQKFIRKCRVPITDVRAFFIGDDAKITDVKKRVADAGGMIVDTESDATHIIGKQNTSELKDQFIISLNAFIKLYYRSLYHECERFKADEEHSPRTYKRIKPLKKTHSFWMQECKDAKTAPRVVIEAAAEEAGDEEHLMKLRKQKRPSNRQSLLKKIEQMCSNDVDPVTLEKLSALNTQELEKIIAIGDERKKHCLTAASAYGVYLEAAKQSKRPRDPLNPSYEFTKDDIERILRISGKSAYSRPTQRLRLNFDPQTYKNKPLLRVAIVYNNNGSEQELYSLGYIPDAIDTKQSKSSNMTTASVQARLVNMLESGALVTSAFKPTPAAIQLRTPAVAWTRQGTIKRLAAYSALLS